MGIKNQMQKKKIEEKLSEVEHANWILQNDIGNIEFLINHLKESSFIRSFMIKKVDGEWSRDISEADRVVYGDNNSKTDKVVFDTRMELKETNSGEVLHIINNPKVVIIKFDRVQTIEYKESLTALFRKQGIVCIILDRCEIDYIC